MKKIGWLIIGSLLAIFPILMAQAGTVSVEIPALEAPEEEIRQALLRAATEKLVTESMKARNLNEAVYQEPQKARLYITGAKSGNGDWDDGRSDESDALQSADGLSADI